MESNTNPAPAEALTPVAEPAAPNQPTKTESPEANPSKSSKTLIWCLSILAIIGIVAAAVFAYLYFTGEPQPESTGDISTSTVEPTESSKVSSIPTPSEVTTLLEKKYDFENKESALCYGDEIFCFLDDLNDVGKIQISIFKTPEELFTNERYDKDAYVIIRNIKYDDLNKVYKDYFGEKQNIEKKDYDFTGFLIGMKYLPEDNSFDVQFADGLGGYTTVSIYNKVVETRETEKGFIATVISVMIDRIARSSEEPFPTTIDSKTVYEMEIPSEDINTIKDSLSAYNFNFIKENSEYKLDSIEKL